MTNIWETLKEEALWKSRTMDDDLFTIRTLWKAEVILQHEVMNKICRYYAVLAVTTGQGCCHYATDVYLDKNIVGADARKFITERSGVSIALLDSIYTAFPKQPYCVHELIGSPAKKGDLRSSIIVEEGARLLEGAAGKDIKVVNVGVVGDIIKKLCARGYQTYATDMDDTIIGQSLHGVTIASGRETVEYIKKSDLAIVTGMTLSTDTLDEIVAAARQSGTKLLIFAETGANFAGEYCHSIGIDTVIAEPFPFYVHQGMSTINVYRK